MNNKKIIKASFFHSPKYGDIEFLKQALVFVSSNGIISKVIRQDDENYLELLEKHSKDNNFFDFKDKIILPGFIDLHIHAPQWPQAGLALDDELSYWLNNFTFPLESKYQDLDYAREVYSDLVKTLLANGTTSAMYFGTIHNEATLELAKICASYGQRGFVGKVVMDDKTMNPDFYRDNSTKEAIDNTEKFILDVQTLAKDVFQGVYPVITPRFVPSCTDNALLELGKLAKKYNCYIQSHCSESDWEHNFVIERFGKRDSEVLDQFGLLTDKSVMAHGNFINSEDADIFKKQKSSVCHCPISNSYFANAVFPVNQLKKQGLNICLGTDISGGFSPSLYDNIKHTVMASRMLNDGVDNKLDANNRGTNNARVSVFEAFYLATTGGGEALKLPLGIFKEGYICDFQVIDINSPSNKLPKYLDNEEDKHLLQKILYLSTSENIREVWVQGKQILKKD
ncbi:guanine deaminase [uncultured Gemella sp.]|uniref:guanine deaminase n=1 Tax=uncultured Gemella sp. TaxID=254352 RepID=UPI0028D5A423|nr:guanine deaminase [uncultured Gemella sp.]